MRSEHIIKMRGGSEHIAWPGLLDLAHEKGLYQIDTELLQVPTSDNGQMAIVKAVAKFAHPDESSVTHRTFSGLGDASPESVSRNIVPHIIRMAETRAKARACRDGVNAGVIEFEDDTPSRPAQSAQAGSQSQRKTPGGATEESAELLINLMVEHDKVDEFKARKLVYQMTQERVSGGIHHYQTGTIGPGR